MPRTSRSLTFLKAVLFTQYTPVLHKAYLSHFTFIPNQTKKIDPFNKRSFFTAFIDASNKIVASARLTPSPNGPFAQQTDRQGSFREDGHTLDMTRHFVHPAYQSCYVAELLTLYSLHHCLRHGYSYVNDCINIQYKQNPLLYFEENGKAVLCKDTFQPSQMVVPYLCPIVQQADNIRKDIELYQDVALQERVAFLAPFP